MLTLFYDQLLFLVDNYKFLFFHFYPLFQLDSFYLITCVENSLGYLLSA